jgi:hypothetical protein
MLDGLVRHGTCETDDTGDGGASAALWSASCRVQDLFVELDLGDGADESLDGFRRWTVCWRTADGDVVWPVRDLGLSPPVGAVPVRRFTWRTGQRHRPGLQFMVSTGRHHGFESLAEQRLLLAVDFAGAVQFVLGQPFRLRFSVAGQVRHHVPDLLTVSRAGVWLFDVRPAGRVGPKDLDGFRAAARVAAEASWGYAVVTGWQPQVITTLEAVSAHRRSLRDPLRLQEELLSAAASGPVRFGDLVAATAAPAVARAHAVHLIWHRLLSIDLGSPLADQSLVEVVG